MTYTVTLRAKAVITLALIGTLVSFLCFYPGYMSPDSLDQLSQARMGHYTDWHPPIMSFVWRLSDRVILGPAGMLVFHLSLLWSGIGLLVYLCTSKTKISALAVLGFGFYPPIFANSGTIWKDIGLGSSLMLATSLLLLADRKSLRSAWVGAVVCLFYGLAVRYNALVAVFPLAIWAGGIAVRLFNFPWRRNLVSAITCGTILWAVLITSSMLVNWVLTKGVKSYTLQAILVQDLVAVSIRSGQIRLPSYLQQGQDLNNFARIYTPDEVVPLFCCDNSLHRLVLTNKKDQIDELKATWLSVIPRNPGYYLIHRLSVFNSMLGIHREHVCLPFWRGIEPNSIGLSFKPSRLNSVAMEMFEECKDSLLFRAWVYLLALVLLASIAFLPCFAHNRIPVLAVACSGAMYLAAYFFVAATCDLRMYWWTVISTLAAGMILSGRRVDIQTNKEMPLLIGQATT